MNSHGSHNLGPRTTILVVDDEPSVLGVMKSILAGRGYSVLTASNAGEALSLFRSGAAPALLVTDVIMPGKNGPDLADALLELDPYLRVLFTAGMPDTPLIRETILDRGHAFLAKPFLPFQLLDKVEEVLAARTCAAAV